MKQIIQLVIIVSVLINCSLGLNLWRLFGFKEQNFSSIPQTQLWQDQPIDHFNFQNAQTFKQRYWVIDKFFEAKHERVILFICGEYRCQGIPEKRQFPLQLAEKYQSLIVVLEHRYYGDSQPFGTEDLTTERLRYLTIENALEDMAYFIQYINDKYKFSNQVKWVTIGGSYPGALSAWFRYKYPHLTKGALASSAVVNAILDYKEYDYQVGQSLMRSGKWCLTHIQEVNQYIESILTDSEQSIKFKQLFNATKLSDQQFLYYISNIYASFIQSGRRSIICQEFKPKQLQQRIDNLIKLAKNSTSKSHQHTHEYYSNTKFNPDSYHRQWLYQTCIQVGWFQTAFNDTTQATRSQQIDITFHKKLCQTAFGTNFWPNIHKTNYDYGATLIKATNLILTNGFEDPWKWASQTTSSPNLNAIVIKCKDCSHCIDLATPTPKDSFNLVRARLRIAYNLNKWFK